jgi:hypothetical protein
VCASDVVKSAISLAIAQRRIGATAKADKVGTQVKQDTLVLQERPGTRERIFSLIFEPLLLGYQLMNLKNS